MLRTPAICGAQTEHPTSVLALHSPAPQLRFVLPAPPSDCSSSSSMGSLDDGTSPGTPAFAAGLPSRSMLPPSQSPAEAQRTQQGMCFDALLAVAQLAQAHQAMREEVGETREIAAARTRHLSGSAGAVPQPCSRCARAGVGGVRACNARCCQYLLIQWHWTWSQLAPPGSLGERCTAAAWRVVPAMPACLHDHIPRLPFRPPTRIVPAKPCPTRSMPTRLPRAVIECGVSRVLQTLPEEDQQQLHDARAFLAAI